MFHPSQKEEITILIIVGFGERTRRKQKHNKREGVFSNSVHADRDLTSQLIVSKTLKRVRETYHVRDDAVSLIMRQTNMLTSMCFRNLWHKIMKKGKISP